MKPPMVCIKLDVNVYCSRFKVQTACTTHGGFKDLIWNFANFWCNEQQANSELTERGNILGVWWPKLCTKKIVNLLFVHCNGRSLLSKQRRWYLIPHLSIFLTLFHCLCQVCNQVSSCWHQFGNNQRRSTNRYY
jgi:hypothetical protein